MEQRAWMPFVGLIVTGGSLFLLLLFGGAAAGLGLLGLLGGFFCALLGVLESLVLRWPGGLVLSAAVILVQVVALVLLL